MKKLSHNDLEQTRKRYGARFKKFGYSPKTLGWLKGKQDTRFEVLTSQYNFSNKSVLDIGCGFGDLNKTLAELCTEYSYFGIDICDELIFKGKELFSAPHTTMVCADFLSYNFESSFHWAIASGIFNHILAKGDNYKFIYSVMEKCYNVVTDGFSFDFIGDRVDYRDEHIFYASPEKILEFAYSFSRRVILRSDYMPFEFSIFVFKNDTFDKHDTIFSDYKT